MGFFFSLFFSFAVFFILEINFMLENCRHLLTWLDVMKSVLTFIIRKVKGVTPPGLCLPPSLNKLWWGKNLLKFQKRVNWAGRARTNLFLFPLKKITSNFRLFSRPFQSCPKLAGISRLSWRPWHLSGSCVRLTRILRRLPSPRGPSPRHFRRRPKGWRPSFTRRRKSWHCLKIISSLKRQRRSAIQSKSSTQPSPTS